MSARKRKSSSGKEEEGVISASDEDEQEIEQQQNIEDYDLDDSEDLEETPSKKRKTDSGEPEVGIIEEITLVNFMSHEHFNIKFGPNVNFIVGENGSGKSAILVALTIGLGAKANFTHRGNKLNDLIRKGASSATITIRLKNRGSEAYKPEEYGDSIIVERRITKDGGGGYTLRDKNGKKISNTRTELSIIMEQFNIQINNPVAILMQDTSRNFLTTASPKDKYKFFLMATQLDQMEKDFVEIKDHLDTMDSMLQRKQRSLPAYKSQLDEYEAEYNQLDSLRKLEDRLTASQNMFAWAHVVEIEEQIEATRREMETAENEKIKKQKEELDINHQHEKAKADLENKNSLLEAASEKFKAITKEKAALEEQIKAKKKELNSFENKAKDVKQRAANITSRRKRVEQHINEVNQKSQKDKSNERNKVQADLQKKRDELNIINEQFDRNKESKTKLEEQLDAIEEQLKKITSEENYKKDKKATLVRDLKQMEQNKKDSTKAFGAWVPALLSVIEKNSSKFKHKPMGPIGMRIKVKDEKWATAIEKSLGGTALSSIVIGKDPGDRELLKQLAERAGVQYDTLNFVITNWKDSPHNLTVNDVPSNKFTRFIDVLEVGDHWIFNALVDVYKIEKKILIENAKEARAVMFADSPPANVKEVWTMEGAKLHNPGGSNAFVPPPKGQRKYLSVDYDKAMSTLEADISVINTSIEEISQKRKEIESERNQIRRQAETLRMQTNTLRQQIQELESWKEDPTEDVSELVENLQSLTADEDKYKNELNEISKTVEKIKHEISPIENQISDIETKIDGESDELERLKETVTKSMNLIGSTQGKIDSIKKTIDGFIFKVQKAKMTLEDSQKKLKDATIKANEWCPRVEVTKSKETISREIQATRDSIAKEKEGRKDPEEVTRNFISAQEKWKEMNEQIEKLTHLKEKLNANLSERVKKWMKFRKNIATRTLQYFNYNLSQKGFAGKLDFDHEAKTLEITVQLEKLNSKQQEIRDTKSLSGGERSYSTVALLLALWEAMETPFRAMDEFDVFMVIQDGILIVNVFQDSVNRTISIQLLIDSALENRQKQYIFISPHDYSVIKTRPEVRIHKMRAVQRGQGTINFSQANE